MLLSLLDVPTREEYLAKIRERVCSRCVERPPEGPPCLPHGKICGIELHLPELIETVGRCNSVCINPYLEENRTHICTSCPHLHGEQCPCPMDRLAVLLVEAIEEVDEIYAQRNFDREMEEFGVGD